jgi:hypothetical protein
MRAIRPGGLALIAGLISFSGTWVQGPPVSETVAVLAVSIA